MGPDGGGVADGWFGLGILGGGRFDEVAALSGLEGGSCNDTPGLPPEVSGLREGLSVRMGMVCGCGKLDSLVWCLSGTS